MSFGAKKIFKTYLAGGPSHIQGLIGVEPETRLLDFKTTKSKHGMGSNDDRTNYSVALSGFANSDGGVIVWGVNCRNNNGLAPDVVKGLKPITDLTHFMSDLHSLEAGFVSPSIQGVEHEPIWETPTSGYALTYVPRVDGFPHMATVGGEHRFYYRAGNTFKYMEQWMVASRFSVQPQPRLRMDWYVSSLKADECAIMIVVTNASTIIAKNLSFIIGTDHMPRTNDWAYRQLNRFGISVEDDFFRGSREKILPMYETYPALELIFRKLPKTDLLFPYQLSSDNSFHAEMLNIKLADILLNKSEKSVRMLHSLFV